MKKLNIRMEQDSTNPKGALNPEYPMIAACYARFGLIRLAVRKEGRGK